MLSPVRLAVIGVGSGGVRPKPDAAIPADFLARAKALAERVAKR